MLFLEYPKCSTCKKAKNWLESNGVEFEDRHIVENNPTAEELKVWYEKSGLPLKRFFNTSGNLYKEKHLKDILPTLSEEELSSVSTPITRKLLPLREIFSPSTSALPRSSTAVS